MAFRWSKEMTPSDAHQKEGSTNMPFRFTGEDKRDQNSWFRHVLFNSANWHQETSGRFVNDIAKISVEVVFHGNNLGHKQMTLDHRDDRAKHNDAPTTYLHLNDELKAMLQATDCTNEYIVFERDDAGNYRLEIQAAAPNPAHIP